MSSVEPAVAVLNLLYNNWTATPAQDTGTGADQGIATKDPRKVHFTNRWFAPVPNRIHPHQITVRPLSKPYKPITIGSLTKYSNFEQIAIHVWVLPNPQLTIEGAHADLYNMLQEIRRIIRILGETAGSGIQHLLLSPWQDKSELDKDAPRLHVEGRATAITFEMSTS